MRAKVRAWAGSVKRFERDSPKQFWTDAERAGLKALGRCVYRAAAKLDDTEAHERRSIIDAITAYVSAAIKAKGCAKT